jgi:CHAD domain-containing protein
MNAPLLPQSNGHALPPPPARLGAHVGKARTDSASLLESQIPRPIGLIPNGYRPGPSGSTLLPYTTFSAVGPRLAESLRNRWVSYCEELQQCREDFSEKSVHELRIATRRLMAQFVLLGCVAKDPRRAEKTRRLLKRRLKALGELRDTHVQRMFLEDNMAQFPELKPVRDFLENREHRLGKAVLNNVNRSKTKRLGKWTSALCRELSAKPAGARTQEQLASAVFQAAADAFGQVVERRQAIDPTDLETIHRTRVAFKKFRYMMESITVLSRVTKRQLRAMACYQRRMGTLQDLDVMQACIANFGQRHKRAKASLNPFGQELQRRRTRALRLFLKSVDKLFEFWPPTGFRGNAEPVCAMNAA